MTNAQDRSPSLPYISGDGFRFYSDFIWDETGTFNPIDVKQKSIIFVKTDLLGDFFKNCHPHLKHPYVLITHNSDLPAPGNYEKYLQDVKLKHWFGQNPSLCKHAKFTAIPIGIANRYNQCSDPTVLNNLQRKFIHCEKKIFVYVNFAIGTNIKARKSAFDHFTRKSWVITRAPTSWEGYLSDIAQSEFVVSPPGNGLDCHRTWEALIMGSIPIVADTNLNPLFDELPVLIISDWKLCTVEFLEKSLSRIKSKPYNKEKNNISFWIKKIRDVLNNA